MVSATPYIGTFDECDAIVLGAPAGTAGVVRNGYLPERDLQTSLGPIPVRIPKVRAKTGEPIAFHLALVPPYIRKTGTLEAALPWSSLA